MKRLLFVAVIAYLILLPAAAIETALTPTNNSIFGFLFCYVYGTTCVALFFDLEKRGFELPEPKTETPFDKFMHEIWKELTK